MIIKTNIIADLNIESVNDLWIEPYKYSEEWEYYHQASRTSLGLIDRVTIINVFFGQRRKLKVNWRLFEVTLKLTLKWIWSIIEVVQEWEVNCHVFGRDNRRCTVRER